MNIDIKLIKWFISEREAIREGKETTDEVLKNSRFCNIYREDDKVSRWIFDNCSTIQQVIIARIVNRIDLLEELQSYQWDTKRFLEREGPVTNAGAYQFYPRKGETIRTIISDIDYVKDVLAKRLQEQTYMTSIKDIALALSSWTNRPLHFYWMMVVLDLGHMKLIDIDMNSEVYMGPGGKSILKAMGMTLEEVSTELNEPQYHAEHILCEVRKYVERTTNGIPNNRNNVRGSNNV